MLSKTLILVLLFSAGSFAQTITTVVGSSSGTEGDTGDRGPAAKALLRQPTGVAFDGSGNMYIADYMNHRIRKVDATGIITTIAGTGTAGDTGDNGPGTSAQINYPWAIAADSSGNVYFTERLGHRVRKIDAVGVISTVAGNGTTVSSLSGTDLGDGGPATRASLYSPTGVAVDGAENIYIGDTQHNRIRKVNAAGNITTVAGNGSSSTTSDGVLATATSVQIPHGLAVDSGGNLYVASAGRIRKVNSAGIISTIAGNGNPAASGDDGPAVNAGLLPDGVDVDSAGNVLIADTSNNRIRKVDSAGIITTIAGGHIGAIGDGGLAINANVGTPEDVAVDSAGNVYIADTSHNSIRKIAAPAGVPVVSAALNAASFSVNPGLTNGALGSIFGTGLAATTAQASSIPLPISLAGVSVTIGGVPAPLLFVSTTQINLQVPWTLQFGQADVIVTSNGSASAGFRATIYSLSPAIFATQAGAGQAIAINPDGSLAAPGGSIPGLATRPAKLGEAIIILATGLGLVTPAISTGAASSDTLRRTILTPSVFIGGVPATVSFSGLSPQFVGVYQLNVVVPDVPAGVVTLQIDEAGNRSSDKVTMAVANP
jgi:uncharacterized protein (TIGR03437 family)